MRSMRIRSRHSTFMRFSRLLLVAAVTIAASVFPSGCSVAPTAENQTDFTAEANAATRWFKSHVPGLDKQIAGSAGYVVYPSIGQWGIVFGGGQFGRGMVNTPAGTQIGWGAINVTSIGLQAGVREFKMLVVIQDKETLEKFKANRLEGSMTGVAVAADSGASGTAQFNNGVVAYQGASSGLMAGVNIGMDYMRFKPLGEDK